MVDSLLWGIVGVGEGALGAGSGPGVGGDCGRGRGDGNAVDPLRGGKVHIHSILITLIAVHGLDSSYKATTHDLSIQSNTYANLDLDILETRYKTFTSAAKTVQSDAATPRAAAAVTTNTRTRSRAQVPLTNPHYPPQEIIQHTQVMT